MPTAKDSNPEKKPAAKGNGQAKKPQAKPQAKAGDDKKPDGPKKPQPKPAPVRQAQAAHGGGRRIGQVLIDLGYIDEDQLWEILEEARTTNQLTGQVAVARGLITEEQLLTALADQHGLKIINLEEVKPTPEATQ